MDTIQNIKMSIGHKLLAAVHFYYAITHQRWLTDITEFKVGDDKLCLSPILDCYNNEIVSYTLSKRPTYDLVSKMLGDALAKTKACRDKTLMLHSDQG